MQMIPRYVAGDLSSPQPIGLLQLQRLQSVIFSVCSPSSVQLYVWSPAHRNEIELHFYCVLCRLESPAASYLGKDQLKRPRYKRCNCGTACIVWNTAITFDQGTLAAITNLGHVTPLI